MWRGLTELGLLAGLALSAGPALALAGHAPYRYDFAPIASPEDRVKPHPEITARYSPEFRRCLARDPLTTYDQDACLQQEAKVQDAAFNRAWRAALARLPASGIAPLRIAERQWIKDRQRHCDAAADEYQGGTIMPLIFAVAWWMRRSAVPSGSNGCAEFHAPGAADGGNAVHRHATYLSFAISAL